MEKYPRARINKKERKEKRKRSRKGNDVRSRGKSVAHTGLHLRLPNLLSKPAPQGRCPTSPGQGPGTGGASRPCLPSGEGSGRCADGCGQAHAPSWCQTGARPPLIAPPSVQLTPGPPGWVMGLWGLHEPISASSPNASSCQPSSRDGGLVPMLQLRPSLDPGERGQL